MKAKSMFKKLGYEMIEHEYDGIHRVYKKIDENGHTKEIEFYIPAKEIYFSEVDSKLNQYVLMLTMPETRAAWKELEELGWIKL